MNWQIAGPIIGGVVPLVLFLYKRFEEREKVKIKITTLDYRVHGDNEKLRVYLGGEIIRSGKKETRDVTKVYLKPADSYTYSKLCQFFKLPDDRLIIFAGPILLHKGKKAVLPHGPADYEPVQVRSRNQNTNRRDAAQKTASELEQKSHEVGLVWDDSGKTTWKTVSKADHGKWI